MVPILLSEQRNLLPVYPAIGLRSCVAGVSSASATGKGSMSDAEKTSLASQEGISSPGPKHPGDSEEFDHLLDSYPSFSQPATGALLHGHVLKITDSEVIVDVGYKCEGAIPLEEFKDTQGNIRVQPGDEIDVLMESPEERDGYVMLSWEKAHGIRVWEDIENAYQKQALITARVLERIKGGLAVDIGVRAFLPGSQIDTRPVRNLDALLGQEIRCKVIKLNRKRGNIVVSRKLALEEEHTQRRQQTLELLQEGALLSGTVKNITDYGAFVDLGGMDGLLHVTDMSWGRLGHPSDIVSVGQQLQVKVLKFDPERQRVSLGLKQLTEDPWLSVRESFPVASRVRGKVLKVTDYGAFVELVPGVEGLIHISEMSWSKRLRHPSKIVSPGDIAEVVVLEVNTTDRRISLGLKQTEPNPWTSLGERLPVGAVIQGRIRNLTDFGAFVEVEEGIDGLIHVSDLSWSKRVKHPSEVLKKGETVQAVVLSIDPETRRLSLGVKQLQPDSWETFCSSCQIGDTVHGKVVRTTSFGVFVELAEGIEGLCHVSEIEPEPADKHSLPLEVGQEYTFKVIKLNLAERKVGLSMKSWQSEQDRQDTDKFGSSHASSGATSTIEEMVAMKERNAPKN